MVDKNNGCVCSLHSLVELEIANQKKASDKVECSIKELADNMNLYIISSKEHNAVSHERFGQMEELRKAVVSGQEHMRDIKNATERISSNITDMKEDIKSLECKVDVLPSVDDVKVIVDTAIVKERLHRHTRWYDGRIKLITVYTTVGTLAVYAVVSLYPLIKDWLQNP